MTRKPIFLISGEGKTAEEIKTEARQAFSQYQDTYQDTGEDEHQDESEAD
ncbi:hypothetical protein [Mycobacterium sp.]